MEPVYSYTEISELLNIPLSSLYRYKREGTGPETILVGKHFRVSRTALDVWLKKNTI
jgi:excisionase family DNA binding protein